MIKKPSNVYVIGLTGGIGTGKTTVSNYLKELGAHVINADEVAHEVTSPGSFGLSRVIAEFGEEMLLEDGSLNRKKLGQLVFGDPEALSKLNSIVHPLVIDQIGRMLEEISCRHCDAEEVPCVVLDVPLLFEAGMDKMCDEIWVVATDKDVQVQRLMARDGYPESEIMKRIQAQMPLEEKVKRAHKVIDNSGSIENTKMQTYELFEDVKRRLRDYPC